MTGLVLEGGARRCLFTAGVLDELLRAGLRFDYVIGVSAGAAAAMDFCAGMVGRTRAVLQPSAPRLSGADAMPLRHQLSAELERLVMKVPYGQEHPFDFDALRASETILEIGATCCETARPAYFRFDGDEKRLLTALKASCSLPVLLP